MLSRRDFHRLALAAVPASLAATKPNSKIHGVQLGAQSYSFRDRSLDEAIKGMLEVGLSECELWQGHIEPKEEKGRRAALREWRLSVSMDVSKRCARSSTTPALSCMHTTTASATSSLTPRSSAASRW